MRTVLALLATTLIHGCPMRQEGAPPAVMDVRFAQAPAQAAACFARNAQAHSSALVAEVGAADARGRVTVNVHVKNGVPYATAELRPAGRGAEGRLTLMVIAKAGIRQLVDELVEGC